MKVIVQSFIFFIMMFFFAGFDVLYSSDHENLSLSSANKRRPANKFKKASKGTRDIRSCFLPRLKKAESEKTVSSVDISELGTIPTKIETYPRRQPLAQLISYHNVYLAHIPSIKQSRTFANEISAEKWIDGMLKKENVTLYQTETVTLDSSIPDSDQEKEAIINSNPFPSADEIIQKVQVGSINGSSVVLALGQGQFLAGVKINSEMRHDVFKYFDSRKSANDWLTSVSSIILEKKQKKLSRLL